MAEEGREVQIAVMANDIAYMKKKLDLIEEQVTSRYISKEEFEPIKRIVYGMVGLILVGVVGALLTLVINK